METSKSRGNGEGTIFKRQVHGKQMWVMEYTFNMDVSNQECLQMFYQK